MSENTSKLIKAINIVHDNFWMTDVEGAYKAINLALEDVDIQDLISKASMVKDIRKELRLEAKEKGMEKGLVRVWESCRLSEELEKNRIKNTEAIQGVLTIHLTNLQKALDFYRQKTLDKFYDQEKPAIKSTNTYKYTLISKTPRYEIRAITNISTEVPEFDEVRESLNRIGLDPAQPLKTGNTTVLRLYSQNEYVEVTVQPSTVLIVINMKEPEEGRVEKIAKELLELLT